MDDCALPPKQGLYDPSHEHDACGIGFLAHIKNRKSHDIIRQGLGILCNLRHRGAVGADPLAGDGSGILIQIPGRVPARRSATGWASRCRQPGEYAVGMVFLPRDPDDPAGLHRRLHQGRPDGGPDRCSAGATCRPTTACWASASSRSSRSSARCSSSAAPSARDVDAFERKLFVIRKQVHHAIWDKGCRTPTSSTFRRCRPRTIVYKGMILAENLSTYYPDLQRRAAGLGAGAGAPAVLDQHLPVVEAGASVPLSLPQRRDQHAARQHQLDDGAPADDEVGAARRRPRQAVAADRRRRVGQRHLRQRARTAGGRRLLAAARDDDDDSRGVGRQPADGREAARLLRVPRGADGAVGRPGGGGLHRRAHDRRHAGPQRPAPGALRHHRRRPVRDVVGSRACCRSRRRRSSRSGGCSRARCS